MINPKKIRILFGKFSKNYDEHMNRTNHTKTQFSIINKFLPKIKGGVLDIATGTGAIANYLEKNTDCEIYGIDYSSEMIQKANKKNSRINLKLGDVHNLPYSDNFFDVVTCSYGYYWFQDRKRATLEIKRVLKSEGLFILLEEEFNKGDPKPRFSKYRQTYLKQLANLEDYIGINSLKHELSGLKFKLIEEIKLPIDNLHDTIGMLWKLSNK